LAPKYLCYYCSMKNLNLYAKIESMIGFDEAYEKLYDLYIEELDKLQVDRLLDLGCGNGNFLLKIKDRFDATGIDLSSQMVQIAREKGVDARCENLADLKEKFDAVVAIGDVLNYIKPSDLGKFFSDLRSVLNVGGYFLCDINTLHGFEDVTSGTLAVDEQDRFLSIDADFFEGVLLSEIVYFQKCGDCYKKESERIFQYYHDKDDIIRESEMESVEVKEVSMFSEEADKELLVLRRVLL